MLDDRPGRAKLGLEVKVAAYYSTDPDKPTNLMMNDGQGRFFYRRDGEWVEAYWLMGKVWNGDAEWVPDERAMEIMAELDRRHAHSAHGGDD